MKRILFYDRISLLKKVQMRKILFAVYNIYWRMELALIILLKLQWIGLGFHGQIRFIFLIIILVLIVLLAILLRK